MRKDDKSLVAFVVVWIFILLVNLAWIGALIWAIIYAVLHMGEWLHG